MSIEVNRIEYGYFVEMPLTSTLEGLVGTSPFAVDASAIESAMQDVRRYALSKNIAFASQRIVDEDMQLLNEIIALGDGNLSGALQNIILARGGWEVLYYLLAELLPPKEVWILGHPKSETIYRLHSRTDDVKFSLRSIQTQSDAFSITLTYRAAKDYLTSIWQGRNRASVAYVEDDLHHRYLVCYRTLSIQRNFLGTPLHVMELLCYPGIDPQANHLNLTVFGTTLPVQLPQYVTA